MRFKVHSLVLFDLVCPRGVMVKAMDSRNRRK